MTLTLIQRRAEPEGEFGRFRDGIERTLETMLTEPLLEPRLFRIQGWMPVVDVSESDAELVIRAEVPGIADRDLDVSIVGDALVISGEKKEEQETSGEDWRRCERRFGAFRRALAFVVTLAFATGAMAAAAVGVAATVAPAGRSAQ